MADGRFFNSLLERRPVWRTEPGRSDATRGGRAQAFSPQSYLRYGENENGEHARRRPQMGVLATGAKPVGALVGGLGAPVVGGRDAEPQLAVAVGAPAVQPVL